MRKKRGFTVIEVVVVIIAISILLAALLPYVAKQVEDSRISKIEQDILALKNACAMFFNDTTSLPSAWNHFVTPTGNGWRGPYLARVPGSTGAIWSSASPWKTDYRLITLLSANQDHRFATTTNLYPFRNAVAIEITNPLVGGGPAIIPLSLQKIDQDIDNNHAGTGMALEANPNQNPFVTNNNIQGISGQNYVGTSKSMYVLIYTY
ncbi:MAG: prepilin-type N-terminal cleavage/methylation domain-containing protein [bacterium]